MRIRGLVCYQVSWTVPLPDHCTPSIFFFCVRRVTLSFLSYCRAQREKTEEQASDFIGVVRRQNKKRKETIIQGNAPNAYLCCGHARWLASSIVQRLFDQDAEHAIRKTPMPPFSPLLRDQRGTNCCRTSKKKLYLLNLRLERNFVPAPEVYVCMCLFSSH